MSQADLKAKAVELRRMIANWQPPSGDSAHRASQANRITMWKRELAELEADMKTKAESVLARIGPLAEFRGLENFARRFVTEGNKLQPLEVLDIATRALQDAKIPFTVVGGIALSVQATPRYTTDVDAAVPYGSLPAAERALEAAGFKKKDHYDFGKKVKTDVLKFQYLNGEELDLIDFPKNKNLQDMITQVDKTVEGKPFTSRESLILMKLIAFRLKDRADLVELTKKPYDRDAINSWAQKLGIFDRVSSLDVPDEGGA